MCVSTGPADFSGTILHGGRRDHPELGRVEVLGYQNTAVNLAEGPNAMVLHLPARGLSQRNFVPVGRDGDVLARMLEAARPRTRDAAIMSGDVQVFDHDIYSVVLAADPTRVPEALRLVPQHRRPAIHPDLMAFYADTFPGHSLVLSCFDNADARRAKPLLLWYPPADPDLLVLPALDCHTGAVPDLDAPVHRDHVLLFGTDDAPADWGGPVDYGPGLRHKLRAFLPDTVKGVRVTGDSHPNGDFAIAYDDLLEGDVDLPLVIRTNTVR